MRAGPVAADGALIVRLSLEEERSGMEFVITNTARPRFGAAQYRSLNISLKVHVFYFTF